MKNPHCKVFAAIGLIVTTCFNAGAQTTRTVCSSGCTYTTIQSAMTAANSGDTILLNVNGAFTEKNIALPEKNLVLKGLGKTTTILQSAATRASGSGGRIFSYLAPTVGGNIFKVEDMTIRYAIAPLADIAGGGQFQSLGGILYSTAPKGFQVMFNNVKMYANETTAGNVNNSGGACFYVTATGSGLTYNADLTFTNCDFDDNKVGNSSGSSLSDGACFNLPGSPARLTINNCTFTSNNGYTRGGIIYAGSNWTFDIKNSSFDGNTCRNGDGGCFYGSSGTWNIENCLFKNNSAVFVSSVNGNTGVGGVFRGKGAKFKNCTFIGNSAVKGGAILRSNNGTAEEMHLINCTFYGNSASSTGKTLQIGSSSSTSSLPLVMVNTIITNGTGTAASEINFSIPYSNLTTNVKNYCNSISSDYVTPGTTPTFDFTSSNTTLGLSATLASNGGNFQTLALDNTSTLINAGSNTTGATYDISAKDNRNYSRTDGAVDVGAYEYSGLADNADNPVITYTSLPNTLLLTDRSLTATITDANGVYWFPQLTDLRPRIYYKKNSGAWTSSVGTLASGNGRSGSWTFPLVAAQMGGVVNGDVISYYVVTQDVSTAKSLVSLPAGVVATDVLNITAHTVPNTYVIGAPLPVKLVSFAVKANNKDADVKWVVSEEINIARYEIERSSDGNNFTAAGSVLAGNKKQYGFTDKNLASGIYYYRLKTIDVAGAVAYSHIEKIKTGAINKLSIYPNPVVNGQLFIQLPAATMVNIYNSNGLMVLHRQLGAGAHTLPVTMLARGTYLLKTAEEEASFIVQ